MSKIKSKNITGLNLRFSNRGKTFGIFAVTDQEKELYLNCYEADDKESALEDYSRIFGYMVEGIPFYEIVTNKMGW